MSELPDFSTWSAVALTGYQTALLDDLRDGTVRQQWQIVWMRRRIAAIDAELNARLQRRACMSRHPTSRRR